MNPIITTWLAENALSYQGTRGVTPPDKAKAAALHFGFNPDELLWVNNRGHADFDDCSILFGEDHRGLFANITTPNGTFKWVDMGNIYTKEELVETVMRVRHHRLRLYAKTLVIGFSEQDDENLSFHVSGGWRVAHIYVNEQESVFNAIPMRIITLVRDSSSIY